ncbi:MAG: hypothetical protein JZU52_06445 [Lamprocystis purpurea]|nr:hypothetical protein [Lamprocystis purpurea]
MTGLAGVFFRDGRCASPAELKGPLAAVVARGLDPPTIQVDGPCGVGIASRPTTPEEAQFPQPAIDRQSGVLVVLDGRLDDPERLTGYHCEAPGNKIDHSDAQRVLRAYLHLGAAFAARLIGDYALAIWDPRCQQLICVRDALGIRPLYYAISRDRFVFGSNVRSVLSWPGVPNTPNLGMLGEYLAFAFCSRDETLYTAVRRLPPAHLLIITRSQVSITRYWDIDPHYRIRYRDPDDYTQHFQTLFRQAVSDRLRGVGPVGVSLSGGLDSSAVAGVAQQVLDADEPGTRLRAYSMTYPGEDCDETPFIAAVAERWRLSSRHIPWTCFASYPWADQAAAYRDIPEYPSDTRTTPLYQGASADGVSVLLTGEGGDYWQSGSSLPHSHLLEALDLTGLIRELRCEAGYTGYLNALRLLAGGFLWRVTPGQLRQWLESRRRRTPSTSVLSPRFIEDIGLEHRLHCGDCAGRFSDASQWQIAKFGLSGIVSHFYEMIERSAAYHGMELRHPFLDRRLIEFSVAIPDHIRRRGCINRHLLRQAMADVYPAAVRERRDKASFGIVSARALMMKQVQQVLQSPSLLERPWIAPDRYRRLLRETFSEGAPATLLPPRLRHSLWILFAVEIWYREVFGT